MKTLFLINIITVVFINSMIYSQSVNTSEVMLDFEKKELREIKKLGIDVPDKIVFSTNDCNNIQAFKNNSPLEMSVEMSDSTYDSLGYFFILSSKPDNNSISKIEIDFENIEDGVLFGEFQTIINSDTMLYYFEVGGTQHCWRHNHEVAIKDVPQAVRNGCKF